MDGRPMIVGAEGHDYDELMHVGADPAPPPPPQRHYGPPPPPMQGYGYPPPGYYPPPPMHQPPPQRSFPSGGNHGAPHPPRHVVTEQPSKSRDFPIGFTRMAIPPGDPVEIEVKPQVLFRGKRLAISPSNAKEFVIIDIKVGKNSQLAATGEMGAEAFSALAVGTQMELDTASPGITITLRVRNISAMAQNFFGVLYGAVME